MAKGNFNTGPAHGGFKHGMHKTRTYSSWSSMKSRCSNKKDPSYSRYGGAGISYCTAWEDFNNFYSDMGERPEGQTLERINNELGYTKENCRWATYKEQARNRSDNRLVTLFGETLCFLDWCNKLGMPRTAVSKRIARGWTEHKAFTTPVRN